MLYEDVDPLYYNVFICPQCCFATRHEEFEKVDDPSKKKIAAVTAERKQRHKPETTSLFLVKEKERDYPKTYLGWPLFVNMFK